MELLCAKEGPFASASGISMGFQVDSLEHMEERLRKEGIPVKRGPFSPNPIFDFSLWKTPTGWKFN